VQRTGVTCQELSLKGQKCTSPNRCNQLSALGPWPPAGVSAVPAVESHSVLQGTRWSLTACPIFAQ
jgi:hypothetical protein